MSINCPPTAPVVPLVVPLVVAREHQKTSKMAPLRCYFHHLIRTSVLHHLPSTPDSPSSTSSSTASIGLLDLLWPTLLVDHHFHRRPYCQLPASAGLCLASTSSSTASLRAGLLLINIGIDGQAHSWALFISLLLMARFTPGLPHRHQCRWPASTLVFTPRPNQRWGIIIASIRAGLL